MFKRVLVVLWATLQISSLAVAIDSEEAETLDEKSPIGSEFYMSQNIGAGTFFKDYQQKAYLATNLYAYPYYQYGPFLGERELKFHAELHTALEWMGENNPFPGKFADKFRLGRFKASCWVKKALYAKTLGFSILTGAQREGENSDLQVFADSQSCSSDWEDSLTPHGRTSEYSLRISQCL